VEDQCCGVCVYSINIDECQLLTIVSTQRWKGELKNVTRALDKELKRATEPLKCQLMTAMLRGIKVN